jgi:cell division protein FtsW
MTRPAQATWVAAVRAGTGRAASALSQWLRRPLTSLHLVLGVFGLLTLFGLVMVLSASTVASFSATRGGSPYSVFGKQLLFCVPGLFLFYVGLRVPPARLRAAAPTLLLISVVLLAAVLVVGVDLNGSRAWFRVGTVSVQPSEVAKVALILWGAHVLAGRRAVIHRWKYALSPVGPVFGIVLLLLVLEPDLGLAVTIGVVLMALLFYAGAPLKLLAGLCAGAAGGALVLALSAPYRLARVTAFLNPGLDPAADYQSKQALYSLAGGGLFGSGLGQGSAKWNYLPNAHNDFIFAIIGQELGFLGAFAVLALFATLAYAGLRIARRTRDPWLSMVVAVVTTSLVVQAAINISYVVGLLPVTGLTLPLISSGGTSLVVTMFEFGVLASAARHEPEAVAALRNHGQGRVAKLLRLPLPEAYKAPARRPVTGVR